LLRQVRKLRIAGQKCKLSPSAVVGTALGAWCSEEFPELVDSGLPYSNRFAAAPALRSFVQTVRQLDLLDASYWLSSAYAMIGDEAHRKQLAMFFTPASITRGLLDDLADQGVDFGSQSFLDPACGGAAFLAPIALRMRDALKERGAGPLSILKHIESHLFGTDLDGTLCSLSMHFLRMALHAEIKATGYTPSFSIHRADSLRALGAMFGQMDVVVCNPPYRKMTVDELAPLRGHYSEVIESQPNLYCLFIVLCVRLLRNGGRAALVTPTSFLSGQYFSALRRFLASNSAIEHIGMVSDRLGVFIDVEQETALTVLRRTAQVQPTDFWADVSVVSGAGTYQSVGQCRLPSTGEVWPIPRSVEDVPLLRAAGTSSFRLSDYGYRVRIGAYVWNRDKRPKFGCAREVKAVRARTAMPLLWSSDIDSGRTMQFSGQPRADGDAAFVDLGDKTHPSVVRRPSVLLQRVTSNDQPRRLVAAAVGRAVFEEYGGFIGENHVVVLEQATDTPALSPTRLARLLAAPAVERYFRCISGSTNVSVFELNQLALPDPDELKKWLSQGLPMAKAAARAFGMCGAH
jgi:adenine-specific DNA-methyltransferase